MAFEYQMLGCMTIFYLYSFIPSSIGKYKSFGAKWLASNRNPISDKQLSSWGARAERAYQNLKDFYPAFLVAILLLGQLNRFDNITAWCSGIYVICRIIHMSAYIAGNVFLRASSWTLAIVANTILLIKVF